MKHNIVSISNTLVDAEYILRTVEQRVVFALISLINNNPINLEEVSANKYYVLNVRTYAETFGIDYEVAKNELQDVTNKLFDAKIEYIGENGEKVITRWVSSIRYDKEGHNISIAWAFGIIPLISGLTKCFTSVKIQYISALPSTYSIRWYQIFIMELAKHKKSSLRLQFSVEDIKRMFVLEAKYALFADLRKYVIEEPIKSINKFTNIEVSLLNEFGKKMYIKEGKKVVGICFNVSWRKNVTKSINEN